MPILYKISYKITKHSKWWYLKLPRTFISNISEPNRPKGIKGNSIFEVPFCGIHNSLWLSEYYSRTSIYLDKCRCYSNGAAWIFLDSLRIGPYLYQILLRHMIGPYTNFLISYFGWTQMGKKSLFLINLQLAKNCPFLLT